MVSIADTPSPLGSTYAIRFQGNARKAGEYEIDVKSNFCPGVYRVSAYVKASVDFDGVQMLLHARFPEGGNWRIPDANGAESGGWPARRDEWTQVKLTFEVEKPAGTVFRWYLGYPVRGTRGQYLVTDLALERLSAPCGGRRRRDAAPPQDAQGLTEVESLRAEVRQLREMVLALQARV